MIWIMLAAVLAQTPDADVYAYNPNEGVAWCASKPVPREEGFKIPADGGFRMFPARPAWCSPGVVMETDAEHKAHGRNGRCPIVEAMWDVTLRNAEKRREGK